MSLKLKTVDGGVPPFVGQLPPLLEIPIPMAKVRDLVTIIMERRHQLVTILTVYPPDAFSDDNELSLKTAGTVAESLRVMVLQNERGRGSIAIDFFLLGSSLCLACSRTVANEVADRVYNRFLTAGTTFIGFLLIPFNTSGESSIYRGGFFVSLECVNVGALTYRFTVGPAHRDMSVPARNIVRGRAIQLNVSFPVPSDFFRHQAMHNSQDSWEDFSEVLRKYCMDGMLRNVMPENIAAAEKRLELLRKLAPGSLAYYDVEDFDVADF